MAKKVFVGLVTSDKMKNTVVITLEHKVPHPKFGKLIKRTQKLMADTNNMEVKIGDIVKIEEIKPMSKNKNFKVVEKREKEVSNK